MHADDWLLSVVSLYLAMQGHPVAATLSNRHRVPAGWEEHLSRERRFGVVGFCLI